MFSMYVKSEAEEKIYRELLRGIDPYLADSTGILVTTEEKIGSRLPAIVTFNGRYEGESAVDRFLSELELATA